MKYANYYAADGFYWWFGVVEDREDPEKLGRVRVRIVGYHIDNKVLLPTKKLPWAIPIQPITSAATSGVGSAPLGPVPGTWVVGFFMDGRECQQPMIFGTIAGKPGDGEEAAGVGPTEGTFSKCGIETGTGPGVLTDGQGNPVLDGQGRPVQAGEVKAAPPPKNQKVNDNIILVIKACIKQGIRDPLILAGIAGNIIKECGGKAKSEYGYGGTKAPRLRELFSSRVKQFGDAELEDLARNNVAFFDYIYGYKSGSTGKSFQHDQPGDGWNYRGRGFIQHTGKGQYRNMSQALYGDQRLVTNPDLLNQPEGAADGTAWFFTKSSAPGAASRTLAAKGITLPPKNQYEADVWTTTVVAGGGIDIRDKKSKDGPIGEKILTTVRQNSANWTPGTPGGDKIAEMLKSNGVKSEPPKTDASKKPPETKKDTAGPLNPPGAGNPPPFTDPSGTYPDCGYQGSPDTNKLAQGNVGQQARKQNGI